MIALDTETTGVDFYHGSQPFFVTTCDEDGEQRWWEWDVDPVTRKVLVPPEDVDDLAEFLSPNGIGTQEIILQNAKFDVRALATLRAEFGEFWPWDQVRDTITAGHVLYSSFPHNLTDMAVQYLGVDISPYEEALRKATIKARAVAKAKFPEWSRAEKGRPDMPSAKETTWKYDTWLPRALAKALEYPEDHDWWRVLSTYANVDSSVTLALWKVQWAEIRRRGLEKIWQVKALTDRIAYRMEERGVTINEDRLTELDSEYRAESEKLGRVCVNIAASYDYPLVLPKSGNNNSLLHFCFGEPGEGHSNLFPNVTHYLKLPIVGRTDTGNPSLNAESVEKYLDVLPPNSKQLRFVKALSDKRKRDTAVTYMAGYRRFWRPWIPASEGSVDARTGAGWYVLHPSLNPTGTDTLRWSSSNPNEQNISKKEGFNLRYCFGPAPGREWWSLDAKNIELRLPAYESGEQEMIDLFEREKEPPYYGSNHILIFSVIWPELWAKAVAEVGLEKAGPHCKKKYAATYYQWTKNGNFAVQYGAVDKASGTGTADRAYHQPGAQAKVKVRFKKLTALNDYWIRFANKHGYVETMPDRTVDPSRGYPLMCTRTENGRILETVPLNYHVQSTAMWWTMKAMIRCQAKLDEWNEELLRTRAPAFQTQAARRFWINLHGYHIAMQVHDEIVFDFPKSIAHPSTDPKRSNLGRVRILQALMAKGGDDLGVPTPVGVEYHESNWSEGVGL